MGLLPPAYAMVAFDCKHPRANVSMINIAQTQPCPDPTSDFHPTNIEKIQIVQTGLDITVHAKRCLAVLTKVVEACGFDGLTYGAQTTVWEQTYAIPEAECTRAFATQQLHLDGVSHERLITHHKNPVLYYVNGDIQKGAHKGCVTNTVPFVSGTRTFGTGFKEETRGYITLDTVTGTHDAATGTISFPGADSRFFDYNLRSVQDPMLGTLVWRTSSKETCTSQLSSIYSGPSLVRTRLQNDPTDRLDREGAIVLVGQNLSSTQHAGFKVGKAMQICDKTCHRITSMTSLVVCFYTTPEMPFPSLPFRPELATNTQILNMASRSDYQFLKSHLQVQDQFQRLVQDVCAVEQKTLHNKIQAISGAGNMHAMMDIYGPGHLITTAGDMVAYITHCVPVNVTRVEFPNCTKEIPVEGLFTPDDVDASYDHKKLNTTSLGFMNPLTRIVQKYPTIVTCSATMPVRWLVGSTWYCVGPTVQECAAPEMLKPETEHFHVTDTFEDSLSPDGIISREQRMKINKFIDEGLHGGAISNTNIRQALENAQNGNLGAAVFNIDLTRAQQELSRSLVNRIFSRLNPFPMFETVGWWWIPFSGFLTVTILAAHVIKAILKFCQEIVLFGWDGGRTLGRAFMELWGITYIPKYLAVALYQHCIGTLDYTAMQKALGYRPADDNQQGAGPAPPPDPPSGPAAGILRQAASAKQKNVARVRNSLHNKQQRKFNRKLRKNFATLGLDLAPALQTETPTAPLDKSKSDSHPDLVSATPGIHYTDVDGATAGGVVYRPNPPANHSQAGSSNTLGEAKPSQVMDNQENPAPTAPAGTYPDLHNSLYEPQDEKYRKP